MKNDGNITKKSPKEVTTLISQRFKSVSVIPPTVHATVNSVGKFTFGFGQNAASMRVRLLSNLHRVCALFSAFEMCRQL